MEYDGYYYGYYYASLRQRKASDFPFTRQIVNSKETWRLKQETLDIIKSFTNEPGPYKVYFDRNYKIIKVIPERDCDSLL